MSRPARKPGGRKGTSSWWRRSAESMAPAQMPRIEAVGPSMVWSRGPEHGTSLMKIWMNSEDLSTWAFVSATKKRITSSVTLCRPWTYIMPSTGSTLALNSSPFLFLLLLRLFLLLRVLRPLINPLAEVQWAPSATLGESQVQVTILSMWRPDLGIGLKQLHALFASAADWHALNRFLGNFGRLSKLISNNYIKVALSTGDLTLS